MSVRWSKTRLLGPADIPPSSDEFRVLGAFNPAAISFGRQVALLVRVAELPAETRSGYVPLPRWEAKSGQKSRQIVDWVKPDEHIATDARVVRKLSTGEARLTSVSHLRVVLVGDDHRIERLGAAIYPQAQYEEFGIEDPRITALDGRYYITYVAVSRHGVVTALASTTDFDSFERHGIIFTTENKDVVLLPERVGGRYVALHRPVGAMPFCGPEMWIARSPDLTHWGEHAPLYRGHSAWESGRVGAGAPPVRTPRGWLEIYHGNRRPTTPGEVGAYCAGGMLLDLGNPAHIAQLAPQPLLEPTEPYETTGFVSHVVFPGAVIPRDDRIRVYYGAADESTAVAESTWDDLWRAFDS